MAHEVKKSLSAATIKLVLPLVLVLTLSPGAQAQERDFEQGTLIIPMDITYQDHGMLQAYGLLYALLQHGIEVSWAINPDKSWHASACNTPGDECSWDCTNVGSGIKCPYPTADPDFVATAKIVWDGQENKPADTPIGAHGYRGGTFIVDESQAEQALEIINTWNDPARWQDNPWAQRSVFEIVSVHQATEAFSAYVKKEMLAAPTIAVFSDGNEDIATSYLRAAGIPQSNGMEFPADKCGQDDCGPDTDNPDMLTVPSVAGDMGTCDNQNHDHKNGALFTSDGLPAYCQIMSMHWDVKNREKVECDGADCPADQSQCSGQTITYHGHEVVAEVREFLQYPVHFFAECQAVNAYENTEPNPSWPWLDDEGRNGHFLTTSGLPPDCVNGACSDGDFNCVQNGCDAGSRDCCLPKNDKEIGAGFLIADKPDADTIKILHPTVPYNQMDGFFQTVGGSEPAYNLSEFLGTAYKNGREVTFITGPNGPGDQDVWMTGYMDGECEIDQDDAAPPQTGECMGGKVSYLGGHRYNTAIPISDNPDTQGARLFLNALFEADCVTSVGQPQLTLTIDGPHTLGLHTEPVSADLTISYANHGRGAALDAELSFSFPADVTVLDAGGAVAIQNTLTWNIGSISSASPRSSDPPSAGKLKTTLQFASLGVYPTEATLSYKVGASEFILEPVEFELNVVSDTDGDGIADQDDPSPDDKFSCGDSDGDTCDDCAVAGYSDPSNDGTDSDGDGLCDDGDTNNSKSDGGTDDNAKVGGCSCSTESDGLPGWLLVSLIFCLAVISRKAIFV